MNNEAFVINRKITTVHNLNLGASTCRPVQTFLQLVDLSKKKVRRGVVPTRSLGTFHN